MNNNSHGTLIRYKNVSALLIIIVSICFVSCDPITGSKVDLLDKINEEVAYANAPWVPLRIETNGMGTASLMGIQAQAVKKGYSFTLVFQPYSDYPFQGWQAWIEGEGLIAWWKPDEVFGEEKVKFVPKNADGTEAEIFIFQAGPQGKQLIIGPLGAEGSDLIVTLETGELGAIYPAVLSGVKQGFPFTLSYQPKAHYPFEGWEARWRENGKTKSIIWKPGIKADSQVCFAGKDAAGYTVEVTINFDPGSTGIRIGPAGADNRKLNVKADAGDLGVIMHSISEADPAREGFPITISLQPSGNYPFWGWQISYTDKSNKNQHLSSWLTGSGVQGNAAGNTLLWEPKNAQGTEMAITIKYLPDTADYTKPVTISPLNADSPQLNVQADSGGLGMISTSLSTAAPARQGFPFMLSFQPSGTYEFRGWQLKFSDGTRSIWHCGDGETEENNVYWSPRSASGIEMNIIIQTLPDNVTTQSSIIIGPLGMDSVTLNVQTDSGELGTIISTISDSAAVRLSYPFTISFQPLAEYGFKGWQLMADDTAFSSWTAAGTGIVSPGWNIVWIPRNASGTDIDIVIDAYPVGIDPETDTITVMPLGGELGNADLRVEVPSGWGTATPAGTLQNRRIGFPFAIEFTPSVEWHFIEWRAYSNYNGPASPGARLPDNSVSITDITAGRAMVTVNTDNPVTLVPWCTERPAISQSSPPLINAGISYSRGQQIRIWFSTKLDPASVIFGNNNISLSAQNTNGEPHNDIQRHFSNPIYSDSSQLITIMPKSADLPPEDMIITVSIGTGITHNNVGMLSPVYFYYRTNTQNIRKVYNAGSVWAVHDPVPDPVGEEDFFYRGSDTMRDRRMRINSGDYKVTLYFSVSRTTDEIIQEKPAAIKIAEIDYANSLGGERNTLRTQADCVFTELAAMPAPASADYVYKLNNPPPTPDTLGTFYYKTVYTMPETTPSGIIRLVILPYRSGADGAEADTWEGAAAEGRFVEVVVDREAPGGSANLCLSGEADISGGVYLFNSTHDTLRISGNFSGIADNMGNGIRRNAATRDKPWTMDEAVDCEWQYHIMTGEEESLEASPWYPLDSEERIRTLSDPPALASSPLTRDIQVRYRDSLGNESGWSSSLSSIIYNTTEITAVSVWSVTYDEANTLSLTWTNPDNVTGMEIGLNGAVVQTSSGTSAALNLTGPRIDASGVRSGQPVNNVTPYEISLTAVYSNGRAAPVKFKIWNIPGMNNSSAYPLEEINTQDDFNAMVLNNANKKYVLVNDISTISTWTSRGTSADPFTGKFYGNGHTITIRSNATNGFSSYPHAGVFGYVNSGSSADPAIIRDLTVLCETASGGALKIYRSDGIIFGGIAGELSGTARIENSIVRGKIDLTVLEDNTMYAGGIVGRMSGTSGIKNVYGGLGLKVTHPVAFQDNTLSNPSGSSVYVGGIAGSMGMPSAGSLLVPSSNYSLPYPVGGAVTVEEASAVGDIFVEAESRYTNYSSEGLFAGGIAGFICGAGDSEDSRAKLTKSLYRQGTITIESTRGSLSAGGAVGLAFRYAHISDCSALAAAFNVSKSGQGGDCLIGGFFGDFWEGTVSACYSENDVAVNFEAAGVNVGGFAGRLNSNTSHCYAKGNVSARSSYSISAGGFAGSAHGSISSCYAQGNVSVIGFGTSSINNFYAGGLVGSGSNVTDSYALGDVFIDKKGILTPDNSIGRNIILAGGLLGYAGGINDHNFAAGSVTVHGEHGNYQIGAGGIVGALYYYIDSSNILMSDSMLRNSAALGSSITITGPAASGYIGPDTISNRRLVKRCYGRICNGYEYNGGYGEITSTFYNAASNYAYIDMKIYESSTYGGVYNMNPSAQPSSPINGIHGADARLNDFRNRVFWTGTQDFSSAKWDFSTVESRGYPILKGLGGQ